MNHLQPLTKLKNRYFVIRHGKSLANAQEIILSHPDEGTTAFGLHDEGIEQAKTSATKALTDNILDSKTIIYSSDFTRCRETAEEAAKVLGINDIHLTPLLRERYFGNYERTSNQNYDKVWVEDLKDPNHTIENVESAIHVQDRTTSLIADLEGKYEGEKIILSSHGDALQILQTGFEKISPSLHRSLPHLQTTEIRELILK